MYVNKLASLQHMYEYHQTGCSIIHDADCESRHGLDNV